MNIKKEKFKLNVTYFKILETVYLLNEKNYYPLPQGVGKILRGEIDFDTEEFIDFPTFKTLISYSSKKICRYVMMLHRYHYLNKKYDPNSNELYLEITELGKSSLLEFKRKYKNIYKQKQKNLKPTIVKIV